MGKETLKQIITGINIKIYKRMESKYMVFRTYKGSGRKIVLHKNLSREAAQKLTLSYKTTKKSMVCFDRQDAWK